MFVDRSTLRDFLRDLLAVKPIIFQWLLTKTKALLLTFVNTGSQNLCTYYAHFNAHDHKHGSMPIAVANEWLMVEAYLHAFSAISKEFLSSKQR